MSYKENGTCSINKEHKYTSWGHNAEPVNSGRCCDSCNNRVVIPARIMGSQMAVLGRMTSKAKAAAARANGKKGGRPKLST